MARQTMLTRSKTFSVELEGAHKPSKALERLEAAYIEHVHQQTRFNQSSTAKSLGLSRGTLRTKLKKYFGRKYI